MIFFRQFIKVLPYCEAKVLIFCEISKHYCSKLTFCACFCLFSYIFTLK